MHIFLEPLIRLGCRSCNPFVLFVTWFPLSLPSPLSFSLFILLPCSVFVLSLSLSIPRALFGSPFLSRLLTTCTLICRLITWACLAPPSCMCAYFGVTKDLPNITSTVLVFSTFSWCPLISGWFPNIGTLVDFVISSILDLVTYLFDHVRFTPYVALCCFILQQIIALASLQGCGGAAWEAWHWQAWDRWSPTRALDTTRKDCWCVCALSNRFAFFQHHNYLQLRNDRSRGDWEMVKQIIMSGTWLQEVIYSPAILFPH